MSRAIAIGVLDAARARRRGIALAWALPWLVALVVAAGWQLDGVAPAMALSIVAAGALAALVWHSARSLDSAWLVRRLDASRPDLEDSSALLFADDAALAELPRLQRDRIATRLAAAGAPDLRAAWPTRPLVASGVLALVVATGAAVWPTGPLPPAGPSPAAAPLTAAAMETTLVAAVLTVTPPAYTRLPGRRVEGLDASVPAGTRLAWRLRVSPMPVGAQIAFHDGRRAALARDGDDWVASAVVDQATLYRIEPRDALPLRPDPLHRIDVVADQPPRIVVTAPAANLTLRDDGQSRWLLDAEASDDYGLAAEAVLRITTAQGTGEVITFHEQSRTLRGSGGRTRLRFRHALDLAALGLSPGDDVVIQLEVRDNRPGSAQATRSPSYILRWPLRAAALESGLDGLVKTTLPAYFRSQRQIIVDAEALLKLRAGLSDDAFLARSDAIGVDQRLLRLRYGQFLGEETEGAPRRPLMPTNDAEDEAAARDLREAAALAALPGANADPDPDAGVGEGSRAAAATGTGAHDARYGSAHGHGGTQPPEGGAVHSDEHDHADHEDHDGHDDRGHDHGGSDDRARGSDNARAGFGNAEAVLEDWGHTHDIAEAATLLDPATRETLRAALSEMWQSELQLRQGQPQAALPYANRALAYIKEVQQADRIYLARVGYEQAPVDASRRMTGVRDGIASRRLAVPALPAPDPAPATLWRALGDAGTGSTGTAAALDDFDVWLRTAGDVVADPLALVAAIDALRRDPACRNCRQRLRARLWPLLAAPPAPPPTRPAADRAGRAYLDALQRGDAP